MHGRKNIKLQFVVFDSYTFIRSLYHVPQLDELSRQTPISNFMKIRQLVAEFFH